MTQEQRLNLLEERVRDLSGLYRSAVKDLQEAQQELTAHLIDTLDQRIARALTQADRETG
ncbi:hypothetical protein [Microbulbifer sp. TYP-18]|uniref:hypothetical protein n=1 Tax=Microbulbifer sp. TYP-18 TaxID=3230024 RepID=UPI0034C619B7